MKYLLLSFLLFGFSAKAEHLDKEILDVARSGASEELEALLNKGADVHAQDKFEKNSLYYAIRDDSLEKVEVLINHGAVVSVNDLGYSIRSRRIDIALFIVDNKLVDLDKSSKYGYPLELAIEDIQIELVKSLISNRVDVNKELARGQTFLHKAVGEASFEIVELLMAGGTDYTTKDNFQETPLDSALYLKKDYPESEELKKIITLFYEKGLRPNSELEKTISMYSGMLQRQSPEYHKKMEKYYSKCLDGLMFVRGLKAIYQGNIIKCAKGPEAF